MVPATCDPHSPAAVITPNRQRPDSDSTQYRLHGSIQYSGPQYQGGAARTPFSCRACGRSRSLRQLTGSRRICLRARQCTPARTRHCPSATGAGAGRQNGLACCHTPSGDLAPLWPGHLFGEVFPDGSVRSSAHPELHPVWPSNSPHFSDCTSVAAGKARPGYVGFISLRGYVRRTRSFCCLCSMDYPITRRQSGCSSARPQSRSAPTFTPLPRGAPQPRTTVRQTGASEPPGSCPAPASRRTTRQ